MAPLSADAKLFIFLIILAMKREVQTQNTTASVLTGAGTPMSSNSPTPVASLGPTATQSPTNPAATTQFIQTTQPPAPPSTDIPVNTDIGPCICDLTGNACDVNCCCDPDCTIAVTQTFSECSENTYVVEDKACIRSSVVYSTNAEPQTVDTTDPSLFCIVNDNLAARNYYTVPQTVETVERFYELSQQYGSTSYEPPSQPSLQDSNSTYYSDFYKSGDVIYTLYESLALGQLGLPRGLISDVCDDNNPAAYLYDESSTCTRIITNLAEECESHPLLSARTYYEGFKIISTPMFLQENPLPAPILVNLTTSAPTTPTTMQPATTPDINATSNPNTTASTTDFPATDFPGHPFYDRAELINISIFLPVMCRMASVGFVVDCNITAEEMPYPLYNATTETCENVVQEVKYVITHNSTDGIEEVGVELVLGSLTSDDLRPSQTFSTMFVNREEFDIYHRSGNPGYVIGQPIMAGDLVEQVQPDESIKQAISVGSDPNSWLTVIKSSSDGSCLTDSDSRIPVTFGENLRSGCTIKVSYENISNICGLIQATALNALDGNHPGYVATFGNSQPEVVGDWVEIFVDEITNNAVSNERGACNNMYMSLHIEVLYANVGALTNPQAKIIGVRYNYPDGSGQTLRYQCLGPYCQAGSESLIQTFEVSVSVEFVDASTLPSVIYAEKPAFRSNLPSDFFYPFSGTSQAVKLCSNVLFNVAVVLVSVCCTL